MKEDKMSSGEKIGIIIMITMLLCVLSTIVMVIGKVLGFFPNIGVMTAASPTLIPFAILGVYFIYFMSNFKPWG